MHRGFRRLGATAIFMVILAATANAHAGEQLTLKAGSPVRVRLVEPKFGSLLEPKVLEGTLGDITKFNVTLIMTSGEAPTTIPRTNIEMIEMKTQCGRRTTGALWGAGAAAVGGYVYGLAVVGDRRDHPNDWAHLSAPANGAAWAALAVPVGALVGALIAPGEQWRVVEPQGVRLGCGRGDDGRIEFRVAKRF